MDSERLEIAIDRESSSRAVCSSSPDLSIVIPIKNERENIPLLYEEIKAALGDHSYEIVYVDDGSTDGSFLILSDLHRADPRVQVVKFQANYGKSAAYSAGFQRARGKIVATMDGDLQDDPSDILLLLRKLEEGYDMVVGWKKTGKSSGATFMLSVFFNAAIRLIAGATLHDMNCPLRVMRRDVAKKLLIYGDLHRYIPLFVAGQGYRTAEIEVTNRARRYGVSKYSAEKYVKSVFDFMTAFFLTRFAQKPLHLFGPLGMLAFGVGFLIDLWLTLSFVFAGVSPQEPGGWHWMQPGNRSR